SEFELVQLNKNSDNKMEVFEKELISYHLNISEDGLLRASYRNEELMLDCITSGDVKKLDIILKQMNMSSIGKMARSDLKQLEYLAVSGVTLATRAAVKGGLNPYEAYEMSDMYLQNLERCRTSSEYIHINMRSMKDFASKVKACKAGNEYSACVKKCREYITHSINQNISIGHMAAELGYNRTYLSKRFKAETGFTIQQYVMDEKVRAAESLLKYSDFTISAISDFLGFSSQSHFGQHVKRFTGLSPSEYRKKNKIVDFMTK
ncbi:MAG: AraC family transcriptional regulator, partial [Spirochaetales bacterium]|nr:AraC family transcriptional regulator [Spirochaetales bacterium]